MKHNGHSALNLLDQFRNEIASLPGAQNATYASGAPLVNTTIQSFFRVEDDMRDLKPYTRGVLNITSNTSIPSTSRSSAAAISATTTVPTRPRSA
jgi:hypothetical protein